MIIPAIWHRRRETTEFNNLSKSPWLYGYWLVSAGVWVLVFLVGLYCWKKDSHHESEEELNFREPLLQSQHNVSRKPFYIVPMPVQPKREQIIPLLQPTAKINVSRVCVQPKASKYFSMSYENMLVTSKCSRNCFPFDNCVKKTLSAEVGGTLYPSSNTASELKARKNRIKISEKIPCIRNPNLDIIHEQPKWCKTLPAQLSQNDFTWDHGDVPWVHKSNEKTFSSSIKALNESSNDVTENSSSQDPHENFKMSCAVNSDHADLSEEVVDANQDDLQYLGVECKTEYYQLTPTGSLSSSSPHETSLESINKSMNNS